MDKTNALRFIPQRPPFVMVDNILHCDPITTRTDFLIQANNLFVREGLFKETGLMENIAQTCAARIGWLNQSQPVRIGVIGAINNFEVFGLPAVGDTLQTTVTLEAEVFDAIIAHAEVRDSARIVAQCDMKVFVI